MHSNYKTKTYNIHTKDKDKGIKHTTTEKIIKSQRKRAREEERNNRVTCQLPDEPHMLGCTDLGEEISTYNLVSSSISQVSLSVKVQPLIRSTADCVVL